VAVLFLASTFPGFLHQIPFGMQLETRESLNLRIETPAVSFASTATATSINLPTQINLFNN